MSSPKTSTTQNPPVSYVELFYDLVMVATVIVFSSKVSHDLSAHNIVWFILVFAMLWWAWLTTTLVLNTARQNDVIVQFLIAVEMLGITLMTILVSDHLGSDRLTVSPTYGAIIFIVALLNEWLRVRGPVDARGIAARRRNAFVVSAVLWAAAGFLPAPIHGIAWIFAAIIMVVPILSQRFSRGLTVPPIDEEHIVERFALLTLLVIGECPRESMRSTCWSFPSRLDSSLPSGSSTSPTWCRADSPAPLEADDPGWGSTSSCRSAWWASPSGSGD